MSNQELHPTLHSILSEDLKVGADHLAPDTGLEEAGLDSLSLVELSVALHQQLGVDLDEAQIAAACTIAGLDQLVRAHLETT
ncbi:acyl carrier protein [Peterkaempfera bronchialis]|uniref:Acyl carrier protein n=1 Tax=Peterkaempfera bronchialis TaxID=2126346 RepID=A0A345STA7_9ACTN|nr:acyl carrier protein [Peterkaempfera bronchialis]AXI76962.1 acyl carrier protein [Peterkaempfera bronchialis]